MKIELNEYTANTIKITFSDIDLISKSKNSISLYYSYKTLIAIRDTDNVYYVSKNVDNGRGRLSQTTAKHLNAIEPNKDNRLKREIFELKAQAIMNKIIFPLWSD